MQANSFFLAANILFGQYFVKQACLIARLLFNFLTPNTCKADPINKFHLDKLILLFHVMAYFLTKRLSQNYGPIESTKCIASF